MAVMVQDTENVTKDFMERDMILERQEARFWRWISYVMDITWVGCGDGYGYGAGYGVIHEGGYADGTGVKVVP